MTKQAAHCQIGCSHATLLTGAAYGTDPAGRPRAAPRPIVARLPAAVSQPGGLEASPTRLSSAPGERPAGSSIT